MPRALRPLLLLLALVPLARPDGAGAQEEDPLACPIRALVLGDDLGLRRVYDGVRRGLELAYLPRVCLEAADDEASFDEVVAGLAASPPPLLFVLGGRTAEALGGRLDAVPRVYVDIAWSGAAEGTGSAPTGFARGRAAAVLGRLDAPALVARLRGLLPDVTALRVAGDVAPGVRRRLEAAGLAWAEGEATPHVLLDLGHTDHAPVPGQAGLVAEARRLGIPLVSDDLDLWGHGAALVVAPDHRLLGRVAADLGRRLLEEGTSLALVRRVAAGEVRLDLDACRAVGFEPPLAFVAAADVVRRPRPRRAPEPRGAGERR